MLTFFTSCCPFEGRRLIAQENAIESWIKLGQDCEIIILGKEKNLSEITKQYNIMCDQNIKYSEFKVPFVSSLFKRAEQIAKFDILCYVNCDIILLSDFLPAIKTITRQFKQLLAVGQRWDVEITEKINYNNKEWEKNLLEMIRQKGKLHSPSGMDYFIFRKGLWANIPDFSLARQRFDNWFVWDAIRRKIPTVDITQSVTVIHQTHPRLINPTEFRKNIELGRGKMKDACHTEWMLIEGKLKKR